MSQELVYTSAPKGLKPGSKGFCTVAMTTGMTGATVERLESLSGYRALYPLGDARSTRNPVNWCHWRINIQGQPRSVLSRVAFAGADYSQRSNKLAHHVVLEPNEQSPAGPANLLLTGNLTRTAWTGEPAQLPNGPSIPNSERPPATCETWARLTGDAGWAAALADAYLENPSRPVYLIYPPEAAGDVLQLFEESMSLLPARQRWEVTFSTFFTDLPLNLNCSWRAVVENTQSAIEINSNPSAVAFDLSKLDSLVSPKSSAITDARSALRSGIETRLNASYAATSNQQGGTIGTRGRRTQRLHARSSESYFEEEFSHPDDDIDGNYTFNSAARLTNQNRKNHILIAVMVFAAFFIAIFAVIMISNRARNRATSSKHGEAVSETSKTVSQNGPISDASLDRKRHDDLVNSLRPVISHSGSKVLSYLQYSVEQLRTDSQSIARRVYGSDSHPNRLAEVNVVTGNANPATKLMTSRPIHIDSQLLFDDPIVVKALNDVPIARNQQLTQMVSTPITTVVKYKANQLEPDLTTNVTRFSLIWANGSSSCKSDLPKDSAPFLRSSRLLKLSTIDNVLRIISVPAPSKSGLGDEIRSDDNWIVGSISPNKDGFNVWESALPQVLSDSLAAELAKCTIVGLTTTGQPRLRTTIASSIDLTLQRGVSRTLEDCTLDDLRLQLVSNNNSWSESQVSDLQLRFTSAKPLSASISLKLSRSSKGVTVMWDIDDPIQSKRLNAMQAMLLDSTLVSDYETVDKIAASNLEAYQEFQAKDDVLKMQTSSAEIKSLDKQYAEAERKDPKDPVLANMVRNRKDMIAKYAPLSADFLTLLQRRVLLHSAIEALRPVVEIQRKTSCFPVAVCVLKSDSNVDR